MDIWSHYPAIVYGFQYIGEVFVNLSMKSELAIKKVVNVNML
jgi:hypothetical protein